MTFSKFIKQKRIAANLSQDTVAWALGFKHRSNVCRLEAGKFEWKLKDVMKMAELFGVKVSELLKEYEKYTEHKERKER
jgi:DNA-binding XRE family transcriptional regulator